MSKHIHVHLIRDAVSPSTSTQKSKKGETVWDAGTSEGARKAAITRKAHGSGSYQEHQVSGGWRTPGGAIRRETKAEREENRRAMEREDEEENEEWHRQTSKDKFGTTDWLSKPFK